MIVIGCVKVLCASSGPNQQRLKAGNNGPAENKVVSGWQLLCHQIAHLKLPGRYALKSSDFVILQRPTLQCQTKL